MTSLHLNNYKRAIADFYDRRSSNYDEGEWREQVCDNLLNYSFVNKGQKDRLARLSILWDGLLTISRSKKELKPQYIVHMN